MSATGLRASATGGRRSATGLADVCDGVPPVCDGGGWGRRGWIAPCARRARCSSVESARVCGGQTGGDDFTGGAVRAAGACVSALLEFGVRRRRVRERSHYVGQRGGVADARSSDAFGVRRRRVRERSHYAGQRGGVADARSSDAFGVRRRRVRERSHYAGQRGGVADARSSDASPGPSEVTLCRNNERRGASRVGYASALPYVVRPLPYLAWRPAPNPSAPWTA